MGNVDTRQREKERKTKEYEFERANACVCWIRKSQGEGRETHLCLGRFTAPTPNREFFLMTTQDFLKSGSGLILQRSAAH